MYIFGINTSWTSRDISPWTTMNNQPAYNYSAMKNTVLISDVLFFFIHLTLKYFRPSQNDWSWKQKKKFLNDENESKFQHLHLRPNREENLCCWMLGGYPRRSIGKSAQTALCSWWDWRNRQKTGEINACLRYGLNKNATSSTPPKQTEGERHSNIIKLFVEGIGWVQPRYKRDEGHPLTSQKKKIL